MYEKNNFQDEEFISICISGDTLHHDGEDVVLGDEALPDTCSESRDI